MTTGYVQNLTNPMPSFESNTPGLDQYGRIPYMAWFPRFVAKTAAYTVKSEESGTWFTNAGATAAVTFTLPAISEGPFIFFFVALADVAITVTAGTADTLIGFNDVDLDSIALSTSSEILGGGIIIGCDGTRLFALTLPGDPRYQTYTLAD